MLALKAIRRRAENKILIMSDSLSSLQAIQSLNCDNPLIGQILSLINTIQQLGKTVAFSWIPSHVGIPGNEKADATAKSSADSNIPSVLKIPWSDLKPLVKEHTLTQWQNEWSNSAPCKMLEIKPSVKPWTPSNQNCRLHEVYLTRLRIGHCYEMHAHLFHRRNPIQCAQCGVVRSVKHVLVDCQYLENARQQFLGTLPGDMRNLATYIGDNPIEVTKLVDFLKSINFVVIYRV